jgi:L-threonylcarbamoyladenylate synthase
MEIIRLEGDPAQAARRAAEVLKAGGIVIYPTDTLYGMAVDAFNPKALARLREVKGREERKPISVVVPHLKAMDDHAEIPESARAIAEQHLPGPLTLVLPARSHVPQAIALDGHIRVRIPNHSFVDALAHRYPRPFTATSANRSGFPNVQSLSDIFAQFGMDLVEIDLVIDAGDIAEVMPSTVLRFDNGVPSIVREGKLSAEELGI